MNDSHISYILKSNLSRLLKSCSAFRMLASDVTNRVNAVALLQFPVKAASQKRNKRMRDEEAKPSAQFVEIQAGMN